MMKDVLLLTGNVINYFAGGNTSKGFYSLFESNLANLERLFILKGGPGTGKSHLIKRVGEAWKAKGYSLEYMYCSSDKNSVDGIIIRELAVGIVDGTKPHVIEPKFPGVIDDYVNLGDAWDAGKLRKKKEDIISLTKQVNLAFQSAYHLFQEAHVFHNKRKQRISLALNGDKMKQLTERLVEAIFKGQTNVRTAEIKHRFHGANTPTGPYSFLEELVEPINKRLILTGRPGTGKSTIIKRLALEAELRGFDAEAYHCGFEPDSIDLLIVRELDAAILANKHPYELQPNRKSDEVIDMEKEVLDLHGCDGDRSLIHAYEEKMHEGFASLAKAKTLRDELEKYYMAAMDFRKTTAIRQSILKEIEQIEKRQ